MLAKHVITITLIGLALCLVACSPVATPTAIPATATPVPPTATATLTLRPPIEEPFTPTATATAAPQVDVHITYVNNAGFLITAGDKKILIDALFRHGVAADIADMMLSNQAPFDEIDLILATHEHSDHFDPEMVAQCLATNPEAVFVSTIGTERALRHHLDESEDQVIYLDLADGESMQLEVNDITIEAIYLSHGAGTVDNLGYIITVAGKKIFHSGDISPDDVTLSYIQPFELSAKNLDVAMIPYFYLSTQDYFPLVLEGIQARHLIPTHWSNTSRTVFETIRNHYPNTALFYEELDSWVLDSPYAGATSLLPEPSPTPVPPTPAPAETPSAAIDPELPLALIGTLIDGTGAEPIPDGVLVIEGDKIMAVGPRDQINIPADAQVIDLSGATILPGFINTHVHNTFRTPNLRIWARNGVTTVRDVGAPWNGRPYFSLRDNFNDNPENARLIAAGPLVTVPGGYPIAGNNFDSLTVESPEDALEKINQLIDDGAEVIKITLTIDFAPSLSLEEATAIVDTAHERGIPVTVHATTAKDLERALDAGVDDIAHMATDHVSNELIQRMIEQDVSWVPTLAIMNGAGAENLSRFVEAGGRVALGNDAGYLDGVIIGMPINEIEILWYNGMTPMQIIVASTRDAAYVCRVDDMLGTLEVGKQADVLVVNGDPLQDLNALEDVRMVIHGGVIIRMEE